MVQIYGFPDNSRTRIATTAARHEGVDVELVETNPAAGVFPAGYEKINFNKKVPALKDGDFTLFEVEAVVYYIARQNKSGILGRSEQEQHLVRQWFSWANSELSTAVGKWFTPYRGKVPFNKKEVDDAALACQNIFSTLDKILVDRTYIVGDRVSVADFAIASFIHRACALVVDPSTRSKFVNLFRYVNTIIGQDKYEPKTEFITEAPQPPKKEEKPKPKPAAAPAPAPAAAAEAPAAKPKHPCEALGPAKCFPLDEAKRQFSNNPEQTFFKWLDENLDSEEYSFYQCDYKYNDELTLTFMSNNLIGGFHSRLEASRKYLFGVAGVYGENKNNLIRGVYLIRGQDWKPIFEVAPDVESFEFKKLDWKNPEDRKEIEARIIGDDTKVGDKVFATGKVFK